MVNKLKFYLYNGLDMLKGIGRQLVVLLFSVFVLPCCVLAQDMEIDFNIIPELTGGEIEEVNKAIDTIGTSGGKVWDNYNEIAAGFSTSKQVASGIMNWDTIMNYLVFVVQFLSELGLVVGVIFIMYAGYKYMISVFQGGQLPTKTVKNAIIGVIIVIFSYAILKTMTSLIGIS